MKVSCPQSGLMTFQGLKPCISQLSQFVLIIFKGYVPGLQFNFGNTYKNGTEITVADFKRKDENRKREINDLNLRSASHRPLKVLPTYPPPEVSHPGTNLRYATAYYERQFCK